MDGYSRKLKRRFYLVYEEKLKREKLFDDFMVTLTRPDICPYNAHNAHDGCAVWMVCLLYTSDAADE